MSIEDRKQAVLKFYPKAYAYQWRGRFHLKDGWTIYPSSHEAKIRKNPIGHGGSEAQAWDDTYSRIPVTTQDTAKQAYLKSHPEAQEESESKVTLVCPRHVTFIGICDECVVANFNRSRLAEQSTEKAAAPEPDDYLSCEICGSLISRGYCLNCESSESQPSPPVEVAPDEEFERWYASLADGPVTWATWVADGDARSAHVKVLSRLAWFRGVAEGSKREEELRKVADRALCILFEAIDAWPSDIQKHREVILNAHNVLTQELEGRQ